MKGVAGICKTLKNKMFMVEWANGNSNTEIDFIPDHNGYLLNISNNVLIH